jgi:neutral ceramidase
MRTISRNARLRLYAAVAAAALSGSLAASGKDETMADPPLRAAYAEIDITPPPGGSMPGYFADRKATGTLDPLKAKVLYLRKGDESIALVACDLIGMGASVVQRIREAVLRTAKPAPDHVWVHCTHTHTGGMLPRSDGFTSDAESIYPGFYPGTVDEAWVGTLVEKTAGAVARAAASAVDEGHLTLHEGREDTIAFYRRFVMDNGTIRTNPGRNNPNVVRPAGEIDPRVHVLKFATARTLAVIYGLHPDCVGGTQYSADYPRHLTEALRESLGQDWRVIFLNACCGNINHVNVNDPGQKSGPDESRRIGRKLAAAVQEALRKEQPLAVGRLAARSTRLTCRLRRPKPDELVEAEERLRTGRNAFEFNGLFAPAAVVLAKTRDTEHRAEIAVLRLGSFGLAAVPGEYFVELGREVETGSPFRPTRTIGLTNGSMGYIPTRQGYVEGGYEAGYRSARYEPKNGHIWAAAAARLLRETAR